MSSPSTLRVQSCDAAEALVSVLVLLLPSEEDEEQLLAHPGVSVGVLCGLLEPVDQLRGRVERPVEGGRVLGQRLEERQRSELLVRAPVLNLLSDRSRGLIRTGRLDVTAQTQIEVLSVSYTTAV